MKFTTQSERFRNRVITSLLLIVLLVISVEDGTSKAWPIIYGLLLVVYSGRILSEFFNWLNIQRALKCQIIYRQIELLNAYKEHKEFKAYTASNEDFAKRVDENIQRLEYEAASMRQNALLP